MSSHKFEELNANKIAVTERVFRIAYLCAKENLAFSKHENIVNCHKLNVHMSALPFIHDYLVTIL